MNWKPAALLPLILAMWGCAEGGTRGSGIFTTVAGNVASVQTSALQEPAGTGIPGLLADLREFFRMEVEEVANARTETEGIRVTVEGTDFQGETDANGYFSVQGDFEGFINLVFQLPTDGGQALIALNVPAAGTLTLNNVRIDTEREEAFAETQDVEFEGIITGVNCQDLTLTLVSAQQSPDDVDQYTLRLDTSVVQDAHGNPVTCQDLREGEAAMVQGTVNPDGTFGHATVELED